MTLPGDWGVAYYDSDLATVPTQQSAGLWLRLGARLIDDIAGVICGLLPAALMAAALRLLVRGGQGTALTVAVRDQQNHDAYATFVGAVLGLAIGAFLYEWLTTAIGGGIGKRIAHLRIVRTGSGTSPGLRRGFVRAFILAATGAVPVVGSILFFLDLLPAIWEEEHRTFHDAITGTVVVYA